MMLFRAVYLRDRANRCITFPADSELEAQLFADQWVRRARAFDRYARLLSVLPWQRGPVAREKALANLQLQLPFEKLPSTLG